MTAVWDRLKLRGGLQGEAENGMVFTMFGRHSAYVFMLSFMPTTCLQAIIF